MAGLINPFVKTIQKNGADIENPLEEGYDVASNSAISCQQQQFEQRNCRVAQFPFLWFWLAWLPAALAWKGDSQ